MEKGACFKLLVLGFLFGVLLQMLFILSPLLKEIGGLPVLLFGPVDLAMNAVERLAYGLCGLFKSDACEGFSEFDGPLGWINVITMFSVPGLWWSLIFTLIAKGWTKISAKR